jgi:hypothetical protein
MAKIAYVGLPAHGHTNPTLPVMKELVRRGHEMYYFNAESFREKVSPTGVHFQALPEPMPSEREVSEALQEIINASLILSRMSRPLARYLIEEFERERPDLVIYDSAAMWGYIAARSHQIPNICFTTTFVLDGSQRAIGLRTMARFLLVLDDFQVIQDPFILQVLRTLVTNLPQALHLVLLTREEPSLPLARLRANNQLSEIRAADLRFSHQETAAFLREVMGLSLAPADISALENKTEGWIAGLQLASLSLRDRADPSQFVADLSGSYRHILRYLTEEVLH